MDKYESNLKLEQMKTLVSEGKYELAAEIADTVNWNKIKNVNALVKVGEIYEKVERYEDAREILLNAYDRSPIGRTIVHRLAEIAIKMQDYEGAQEYYEEFVDIAPHDNQKYILKYNIMKAKGASCKELIPILEEFKDKEYTEEWAFELAYLYHKEGMIEKCIDACDELILWFGDGPYVEHSLELKMLYQPLSSSQEEKYKQFRSEKEGKTLISATEMTRSGEYVHETVAIPQITLNPSRFNTTNLQEEIVKGMQQILEATEKETVVGTMDNIKKIAEEIPYLQLPTEEELAAKEAELNIETDEEIDGALRINFQELLGEEDDGQISLVMKEKAQVEQQITGQMTIAEVLEEWEKTKRAAETVLQEAEQRKLESAKARALHEAEDIMDRLNDVIPKIEAVVSPNLGIMDAAQEEVKEAGLLFESMNSILDKEISRLNTENREIDIQIKGLTEKLPEIKESLLEALEEQDLNQPVELEEQAVGEELYVDTMVEERLGEEIRALSDTAVFEKELQEELASIQLNELKQEDEKEHNEENEGEVEGEAFEDSDEGVEEEPLEDSDEEELKPWVLSDEQKTIFSYFIPVKGMEKQLSKALGNVIHRLKNDTTSTTGNLIIQGSQGCGKTVLATSVVKVLQMECGKPNGRVGKIDAQALNQKDLHELLKKVAGGCLIIERAGDLDRETVISLSLLLEQDESGLLIILEDTSIGIKKVMMVDDSFAKKFTETITVPIFTNDELVVFAQSYGNEMGYVIDEMAILALHNRISNIEKFDQATTLVEVKEIIDEAIEREANSGLRKAFNILTAKRYTDDDKIVLTEKDFE